MVTPTPQGLFKNKDTDGSKKFHMDRVCGMEDYHAERRSSKLETRGVNAALLGGLTISVLAATVLGFGPLNPNLGGQFVALLFVTGLLYAATQLHMRHFHREFKKQERMREEWECRNYIEGERKEMVDLYASKGLSRADAKTVVDILSKDERIFVDVMMVEELGFSNDPEDDNLILFACAEFLAVTFSGAIPWALSHVLVRFMYRVSADQTLSLTLTTLLTSHIWVAILAVLHTRIIPGAKVRENWVGIAHFTSVALGCSLVGYAAGTALNPVTLS